MTGRNVPPIELIYDVKGVYQIWSFGLISAYKLLGKAVLSRFRGLGVLILEPDDVHRVVLCRIGTRHWISRESNAPAEVVDGTFEDHLTEFQMPTSRTHGGAERALDA